MTFDFQTAITMRPGGDTRAELVSIYGDPTEGSAPDPTRRGWFTPGAKWTHHNLVSIPTTDLPGFPPFGEQIVQAIRLHRIVAPVFVATWAELMRRGLNTKLRTYSGAYAARHMGYDTARPVSVHAYGAAIDFDAAWNGYGVPLDRMQINREVVRAFQECGWEWGGLWSDPYEDGMHFQWTDPLSGVRQPEWRDACGRPGGAVAAPTAPVAVPPAPPATPPRQPGVGPDRNWYPVHDPSMRPLPGLYDSLVQNTHTGEMRLVRVTDEKLRAAGLL